MRLSVSMIVRLEEACLATCLESVRGADELVVVDTRLPTDPVDHTREIAEAFGAQVYEYPWHDDFAAARNFSLSKCTGDWVIVVDADEVLEPGGMEKIRAAIARAGDHRTVYVRAVSEWGVEHPSPRVFRRCPEVRWERAAHNYLVPVEDDQKDHPADITITYGCSPAHQRDPDRTLRILTKMLEANPGAVREAYYLACEHRDRGHYAEAIRWYRDYLDRGTWAVEVADAWVQLAECIWAIATTDEERETARDCALQAIKINADFREALLLMADMSGPKNRERWKVYAELSTSEDVLFDRRRVPCGAAYYDRVFAASRDMTRYEAVLRRAASWCRGRVLDVCCGTGELGRFLADYAGVDFSAEAVRGNPRLRQGDVFVEDLGGYDTYAILEALEHLDDRRLLERLPEGATVVCSVPSFNDPAHVRTYNERIIHLRFDDLLRIEEVVRFNWDGRAWGEVGAATPSYILLVRATRR